MRLRYMAFQQIMLRLSSFREANVLLCLIYLTLDFSQKTIVRHNKQTNMYLHLYIYFRRFDSADNKFLNKQKKTFPKDLYVRGCCPNIFLNNSDCAF